MSGSDGGISGGSQNDLPEGDQAPTTVYQQQTQVQTQPSKKPPEQQQKVDKKLKEVIEEKLQRYYFKGNGHLNQQFFSPYFIEVCQALSVKVPEDPGDFLETAKKQKLIQDGQIDKNQIFKVLKKATGYE